MLFIVDQLFFELTRAGRKALRSVVLGLRIYDSRLVIYRGGWVVDGLRLLRDGDGFRVHLAGGRDRCDIVPGNWVLDYEGLGVSEDRRRRWNAGGVEMRMLLSVRGFGGVVFGAFNLRVGFVETVEGVGMVDMEDGLLKSFRLGLIHHGSGLAKLAWRDRIDAVGGGGFLRLVLGGCRFRFRRSGLGNCGDRVK
jgi:hypothetical protein